MIPSEHGPVRIANTLLLALTALLTPTANAERIALLKGTDLIVIDGDGNPITQIMSDPRPKGHVAWVPGGEGLAYQVRALDGAKSLLVIRQLDGRLVREVPIRPITDPPTEGLRYVEGLTWLTPTSVRVWGSVNPRNCELFDLDVESGKESNWHVGECDSFTASPDGKHLAYLGRVADGPDVERFDSVVIDDERVVYEGGGEPVRVLSGLVWASDSKRVAFTEAALQAGEAAVTVVSLEGRYDKVRIAKHIAEARELIWVGDALVAGSETQRVVVHHRTKEVREPSAAVLMEVERAAKRTAERYAAERRTQDIVRRLGGREGASDTAAGVGK